MTRRDVVVTVVAVLLFAWVFLYRFNTLGGSLGGFDNDHFLYMTLAKQVEAGEQPLRDFLDGVHGARPSLTYELSAGAQRLFGDNLRSEAWLTVTGVALGATVTFLAGSLMAPWPWALSTALVSGAVVAQTVWISQGPRHCRCGAADHHVCTPSDMVARRGDERVDRGGLSFPARLQRLLRGWFLCRHRPRRRHSMAKPYYPRRRLRDSHGTLAGAIVVVDPALPGHWRVTCATPWR